MTKETYDLIVNFPVELMSTTNYKADRTVLKRGDSFIAMFKKTIGENDHSFIDQNGHPHNYEGCKIR